MGLTHSPLGRVKLLDLQNCQLLPNNVAAFSMHPNIIE
jgi:hypothetical protein